MPVFRSSERLPVSEGSAERPSVAGETAVPAAGGNRLRAFRGETAAVAALLVAISAAAVWWFYHQGYLLYFGDALAHLNIARRIVDSRTPGYDQIGTVWLPLPHLLMLPFVGNETLWRTGLAGTIPVACCFVAGGLFLFGAVRRSFDSSAAAFGAVLLLASNPNMLYLQAVPMTEAVFFCALFALAYFTVAFAQDQTLRQAAGAGFATLAATMIRYDGWFLIPFAALFFLWRGKRNRILAALIFSTIACAGPLYWLAHNWWYYGDALEFFHGPYSAKGIYETSLAKGMQRYQGDHDWGKAVTYFIAAARLCSGNPLVALAGGGLIAAIWRKRWWLPMLFLLPPFFYVWSMHSGGTPIFVPKLWPFSYYNTRYGLAAFPLLIAAAAALIAFVPSKFRALALAGVVVIAASPWVFGPAPESWICWKESQVNSEQRRAWTKDGADYLRPRYHGGGIFTVFGDLTGIFLEAGLPLKETLHSGNAPHWQGCVARPDLFLWEEWAVASSDTPMVISAIQRARKSGLRYECVRIIALRGAPVIEIYRRVR